MGPETFLEALRRYLHLVVRPEEEWNLVVAEKPTLAEAIFPFTVIGILVSFIAGLVGALIRVGEHGLLGEILFQPVVDLGTVAAFAATAGILSRRFDAVRPELGERSALYAASGLWLSSVLGFVPVPVLGWLWFLMGTVYTGYLFHLALDVAVAVPDHARLKVLAISMAALVGAGSLLRLVEHFLSG
jgi:hypothetical protein